MPQDFRTIGTKIIGVGKSYTYNWPGKTKPDPLPEPLIFLKPVSSYVGDGQTIQVPEGCTIAHEVELAIVIGKRGKNIKERDALDHVSGYALALDMCAKNVQQVAQQAGHPWSICKGLDSFTPIGRFITKDELGVPGDVHLKFSVNDQVRQQGSTKDLIYTIAQVVAYISGIFTLEVGDVILTGTPEGVGLLDHGDRVQAQMRSANGSILDTLSLTVEGKEGGYSKIRHWIDTI
ncbi:hypothetical protein V866_000677 [Kwoniella sp. B9012]